MSNTIRTIAQINAETRASVTRNARRNQAWLRLPEFSSWAAIKAELIRGDHADAQLEDLERSDAALVQLWTEAGMNQDMTTIVNWDHEEALWLNAGMTLKQF